MLNLGTFGTHRRISCCRPRTYHSLGISSEWHRWWGGSRAQSYRRWTRMRMSGCTRLNTSMPSSLHTCWLSAYSAECRISSLGKGMVGLSTFGRWMSACFRGRLIRWGQGCPWLIILCARPSSKEKMVYFYALSSLWRWVSKFRRWLGCLYLGWCSSLAWLSICS